MRGSTRASIGLLLIFLLSITYIVPSASATLGYRDVLAGESIGLPMPLKNESDLHIAVNGNGSNHFNVFVITEDQYRRHQNNESFAYMPEYSMLNVTAAYINGTLPAGSYYVLIETLDRGDIEINEVMYGPHNGEVQIPWDMIAMIAITAAITSLLTYFYAKRKFTR